MAPWGIPPFPLDLSFLSLITQLHSSHLTGLQQRVGRFPSLASQWHSELAQEGEKLPALSRLLLWHCADNWHFRNIIVSCGFNAQYLLPERGWAFCHLCAFSYRVFRQYLHLPSTACSQSPSFHWRVERKPWSVSRTKAIDLIIGGDNTFD